MPATSFDSQSSFLLLSCCFSSTTTCLLFPRIQKLLFSLVCALINILSQTYESVVTVKDVQERIMKDTFMELHDEGVPLSVLTLLTDFYIARIFTTSTHYYGITISCLGHFMTSKLFACLFHQGKWVENSQGHHHRFGSSGRGFLRISFSSLSIPPKVPKKDECNFFKSADISVRKERGVKALGRHWANWTEWSINTIEIRESIKLIARTMPIALLWMMHMGNFSFPPPPRHPDLTFSSFAN